LRVSDEKFLAMTASLTLSPGFKENSKYEISGFSGAIPKVNA
jgi:hypothetical protein